MTIKQDENSTYVFVSLLTFALLRTIEMFSSISFKGRKGQFIPYDRHFEEVDGFFLPKQNHNLVHCYLIGSLEKHIWSSNVHDFILETAKDKHTSVLNVLLARALCYTLTWCKKDRTSESLMQFSRALVVTVDTIVSLMSFWSICTSFHTFHTCCLLASTWVMESSRFFTPENTSSSHWLVSPFSDPLPHETKQTQRLNSIPKYL